MMMSEEVSIRLREILLDVDNTYNFAPNLLMGESLESSLRRCPKYIQNFMWNFTSLNKKRPPGLNLSCPYPDGTLLRVIEKSQEKFGYHWVWFLSSKIEISFPSTASARFYMPINQIEEYNTPEVISLLSCKENLIDLVCSMIISEILIIPSYKYVCEESLNELIQFPDRIKGQLGLHRIIAEVTIYPKEIKLREQLNLLYF